MAWCRTKNGERIYLVQYSAEKKYRDILSNRLIENYGEEEHKDNDQVKSILRYSLDYFIAEFKARCNSEKSVAFYQTVFLLHEDAIAVAHRLDAFPLPQEVSAEYFVMYRRILKFILESGCDVDMITNEAFGDKHDARIAPILDDLIFLGEMALSCASYYSEQDMIAQAFEVVFDEHSKYIFKRHSDKDAVVEHILQDMGVQLEKIAVDEDELSGINNFYSAIQECFNFDYKWVNPTIAAIHKKFDSQGGAIVGVGWRTFPMNLSHYASVPEGDAEVFFSGLKLDRDNKMDLLELVCKPYKTNRYLYRPILGWNIDGGEYYIVGKKALGEAITQIVLNSIPWGKAPPEWMSNDCFKKFVHKKENEHAGWLEDQVEQLIMELNLPYDRNVERLLGEDGYVEIDIKGLGEIDFVVVSEHTKTIYLIDCKNLLGRFDSINQKNDFNVFCRSSKKNKSYNEKIEGKVSWFKENRAIVSHHLGKANPEWNGNVISYKVEGVFVVNTKTMYMYMAKHRIYVLNMLKDVFMGEYEDPIVKTTTVSDGFIIPKEIRYPFLSPCD